MSLPAVGTQLKIDSENNGATSFHPDPRSPARECLLRSIEGGSKMGRLFVGLVFLIGFVIFTVIKLAAKGTVAAYQAVFDPQAKDARTRELVELSMHRVNHAMHQSYRGRTEELSGAIEAMTPIVQSTMVEKGVAISRYQARALVCEAIVNGGHATQGEVLRAMA